MRLLICLSPAYDAKEVDANVTPESVELQLRRLAWDDITYVTLETDATHWIEGSGSSADGFSIKYQEGDNQTCFITEQAPGDLEDLIVALRSYAAGGGKWKTSFRWARPVEEGAPPAGGAYDELICGAIKGSTRDRPQDLAGVLFFVDAHDKTVLDREELEGGLRRLLAAGRIAQTGWLRFSEGTGRPAPDTFRLSRQEYRQALEDYHRLFEKLDQDQGYEFTRQKLVIRWKLPGDRYPEEEDQRKAGELAERLDQILSRDGRAEINGVEHGPGGIDILVFGLETDEDTDAICALLKNVVASFRCPAGSCIIRQYVDSGEETVSDIVPG